MVLTSLWLAFYLYAYAYCQIPGALESGRGRFPDGPEGHSYSQPLGDIVDSHSHYQQKNSLPPVKNQSHKKPGLEIGQPIDQIDSEGIDFCA